MTRAAQAGLALVTGGSSGIGLAVAGRLLQRGWSVALVARNAERLEAARASLLGSHAAEAQQVTVFPADVSVESEAARVCTAVIEAHGIPELVVLSAGVTEPGYFARLDSAVFRHNMDVNYFGSLWMARALLEPMAGRGSGSLVLVSSAAGLVGIFGYSAYSPSKFAVRGLGEVLHAEYTRRGVHIGVVYPPDTDTPMLEAENRVKPVETQRIAESGGLWNAEDVAATILRGVEKRQFMITPGWEVRLLARLHSPLLPLLQRWFDRLAHRGK